MVFILNLFKAIPPVSAWHGFINDDVLIIHDGPHEGQSYSYDFMLNFEWNDDENKCVDFL